MVVCMFNTCVEAASVAVFTISAVVWRVDVDAPIIDCPLHVDVERQTVDLGRPVTISCDVESYPAFTVRWRCCGIDRDIPDSVVYEKVCTWPVLVALMVALWYTLPGKAWIQLPVTASGFFAAFTLTLTCRTSKRVGGVL